MRGKEVHIANPNVANALGIGMVHQHFKLVHNFTVTENIMLGHEPADRACIDRTSSPPPRRVKEISERYGLNVDPDAKIEDISVGMQQRVEILKMLYRDAEMLIFDEPTAVLTPQEIQELMDIMRSLKAEGKSIMLITHKLKEIKAIADRCTVLRRGKHDRHGGRGGHLARPRWPSMMVGREVFLTVEKKPVAARATRCSKVEDLSVMNSRKVLGAEGLLARGAGRGDPGRGRRGRQRPDRAGGGHHGPREARVAAGYCSKGRTSRTLPIRRRIRAGMAHIPEDRHKHGLDPGLHAGREHGAGGLRPASPFRRHGLLNREAIRGHAEQVMDDFDVRAGKGTATPARSMSGGNQQKAIVGREIELDPDLLIAVQPTRGLDVGAIEYIHKRLVEQRDNGKAVLLVSLELDEILNVADRVAVVCRGELVGVVDVPDTDENEIGLMMTGTKRGRAHGSA